MKTTESSICIIEDNDVYRQLLKEHINGTFPDLKVTEFSRGEPCLKELALNFSPPPGIMLLDYFLNVDVSTSMDGIDILMKVKQISPDTKVVMLTQVDNEQIVKTAKKFGATDFIVKDKTAFERVKTVLKKLLGNSQNVFAEK